MRVIAVRMVLRQGASVREMPEEAGLAALEALPTPGPDAELALMKSHYRHEFRQAVQAAFAALSDDQRYLLRLHFIEGSPTTRMAPLFGKDQSTISRWLKDVRQRVYEETKRRLRETLRLSSQEFEQPHERHPEPVRREPQPVPGPGRRRRSRGLSAVASLLEEVRGGRPMQEFLERAQDAGGDGSSPCSGASRPREMNGAQKWGWGCSLRSSLIASRSAAERPSPASRWR